AEAFLGRYITERTDSFSLCPGSSSRSQADCFEELAGRPAGRRPEAQDRRRSSPVLSASSWIRAGEGGQAIPSDRREHRLRFVESSPLKSYTTTEDLVMMPKRRVGRDNGIMSHIEWLNTVQAESDGISGSFIPITSLLNGVPGSGSLSD
ncbi:hypothetical protein BRADI_2g62350v3, partial [Brachypodium distachyon]